MKEIEQLIKGDDQDHFLPGLDKKPRFFRKVIVLDDKKIDKDEPIYRPPMDLASFGNDQVPMAMPLKEDEMDCN